MTHVLWRALALSTALHLVLLWRIYPVARPSFAVPGGALRAVLRPSVLPTKTENETLARPALSRPPAAQERPELARKAPLPKRPLIESAKSSKEGFAPSARPASAAKTPALDATPATTKAPFDAERASEALASTALVEHSASTALSADALRQYRVALASATRRFKHYPPVAKQHGWEGAPEVAILFDARLPMPRVALSESSGHALLDEQAVLMLTQAVRYTSVPDALKGRNLRVVLSIRFSLDETP